MEEKKKRTNFNTYDDIRVKTSPKEQVRLERLQYKLTQERREEEDATMYLEMMMLDGEELERYKVEQDRYHRNEIKKKIPPPTWITRSKMHKQCQHR